MMMSNHNPRVMMGMRMSESERFDRDIASVTSSLDVCLISELGITYGKEELGGSIILNHT